MNIAIVGAGLAGLGALWHLLQIPDVSATLFDPVGPGGGASGVSTGLLHPFPGKHAYRSWRAEEGMKATFELLAIAQEMLGKPVAERSGIFRPALTEEQRKDFAAQVAPDAEWWEENPISQATAAPGLFIPQGTTVYSRLYLEGLWKACLQKRAKLVKQSIGKLSELASFDAILLATGASTLSFPECAHLPLSVTKGQSLLCRWPERLPFALLSQGHITATEETTLCQIGSTYEHHYTSYDPDPQTALPLLEKVASFYPPARHFPVVEIRAGARISPKGTYKPLALQINPKTWVFTGLGSRGLLYHSLLGKELALSISSSMS